MPTWLNFLYLLHPFISKLCSKYSSGYRFQGRKQFCLKNQVNYVSHQQNKRLFIKITNDQIFCVRVRVRVREHMVLSWAGDVNHLKGHLYNAKSTMPARLIVLPSIPVLFARRLADHHLDRKDIRWYKRIILGQCNRG